ncbi:hypothetical protein DKZ29_08000 [Limosilactobacillus reuteri]|uniref:hypothetical protein n=1 Tax=Limosilactobacillus reuteri TaxID=1598 RepID=UPI000D700070|nr:hypothetical protein [Limosilactobacillus reuteri]PWT35098.1 hypothetical protein DKZ24_05165 [Limosilactobacillus reuteri]PWT57597.1 hypothetical protein DKZ29_08000 [Limosilactobacillus reuteri]PWT59957.1 hypothetical protein DKZ30_04760 [Limosilactobacillus reuteri]PWT66539.1 hypothetical protein DKZ28_04850 [Limosilactobacillus reuteri]
MATGLNDEFYKHLHALDERYGYSWANPWSERTWAHDAKDDDPDLVFCQNYVKKKFPKTPKEELEEKFDGIFFKLIDKQQTTVAEIASVLNCRSSDVRRLIRKHELQEIYDKYQKFFRSTVIYDEKSNEYFAALTMNDLLDFCNIAKTNRPNVSRAKSTGRKVNGYLFYFMEDYLHGEKPKKSKVEELYEKKVTRLN